jgi:glycosyltransferase involved in cell wall biosynthesis
MLHTISTGQAVVAVRNHQLAMTERLSVTVCITTFRRPEGLRALLRSIDTIRFDRVAEPQISIVVVDNDAEAPLGGPRQQLDLPCRFPLTYVVEPKRGLSAARNCALDSVPAHGEFIVFVDDDERVEPQWLDALLATQRATGADVVQGAVLAAFERPPPTGLRDLGLHDVGPFVEGETLDFGATGNVLISKRALERSGARFDMHYNLSGGEDVDFFAKLSAAGCRIAGSARAIAHETVPMERTTPAWIRARAFRKGNTLGHLARRDRDWASKVQRVVKGGARFGLGVAQLPLGFWSAETRLKSISNRAWGLGTLAAFAARSPVQYGGADVHPKTLSLISESVHPCGIEAFARRLAVTLEGEDVAARARDLPDDAAGFRDLWRGIGRAETVIVNLPVVAWKRRLAGPPVAMLMARFRRRNVVLVLHEWDDLDRKRRLSYLPLLPLVTHVMFSSPVVASQFAADPVSRIVTRRRGVVPIPPNMKRPARLPETALTRRLSDLKSKGHYLLGHFGSIYPRKQSMLVLDIAADLKRRGVPVKAVFIGDFISGGSEDPRIQFENRVAELGLADDVIVSGYIGPADELFAALGAVDAFIYLFAEGLTSRRGSVLACLQSGKPVFVNAPPSDGEFAHHPAYRALIADGRLTFLAHDSTPEAAAGVIASSRDGASGGPDVDFDACWADVAAAVRVRVAAL